MTLVRSVWSVVMLGFGWLLMSCNPPDHPTPENPPCLSELTPAPKSGFLLKRENVQFKVTFSKEIEPATLSVEESKSTIYLVAGEIDDTFISDMESPPLIDSRKSRLVRLKLDAQVTGSGSKARTELTITPLEVLQGDTIYYLVITKQVRDRLIALDEGRFSGSRPINFCQDEQGLWRGSLDEFKAGRTERFEFRTEAAPPRTGIPKVVEVMASPPSAIGGGEYVEILNAHPTETLNLCGFLLGKDPNSVENARKIAPFDVNGTCRPLNPGERAVVIESDYDKTANPYKIPNNVPLFTTILSTGSRTTTLFSGNLTSSDPVILWDESNRIQYIDPQNVANGDWPSSKSLEKCNPDGANDSSNWKPSKDVGTPGQPPSGCP